MSMRNSVQRAFDQFGASLLMEKHSGSWYRRTVEVITVLNLQKSQYGPKYFFNVGFWLIDASNAKYPKEWECQIRSRLDELLLDLRIEIRHLLDLSTDISDDFRMVRLQEIFHDRLLPIIEKASSLDGLRLLMHAGAFKRAAVVPQATSLLKSTPQ